MSETTFKAGAAAIDITGPLGSSLAGHMEDRQAANIHDPLHARCLVLESGDQRVALAICDLVAISGEQVMQARHLIHSHTGIPMSNILIAATHSHNAITPAPLFQSDPNPKYLEWLVTRIADGVRCAAANLMPARIGWGRGHEPSQVFNRRFHMKPGTAAPNPWGHRDAVMMNPGHLNPNIVRPAGPTDPEVGALAIQHEDGQPLALLANYALHYVGDAPANQITADYFAAFCGEMNRMLDPGTDAPSDRPAFMAAMTNGCSGNINNIDFTKPAVPGPLFSQIRKVSRVVAAEAFKTWKQITFTSNVTIGISEASIEIGVRRPNGAEIDEAKKILAASGPELKSLAQIYARESVLLAEYPDKVPSRIQAMRIGDFAIVTLPGEIFVEIGLELKKRSPFAQTICIELANDYRGYFPNADAYALGGYETWRARSAFAAKGAAEELLETGLKLLNELKQDTVSPSSKPS